MSLFAISYSYIIVVVPGIQAQSDCHGCLRVDTRFQVDATYVAFVLLINLIVIKVVDDDWHTVLVHLLKEKDEKQYIEQDKKKS